MATSTSFLGLIMPVYVVLKSLRRFLPLRRFTSLRRLRQTNEKQRKIAQTALMGLHYHITSLFATHEHVAPRRFN